jgi:hypothetical protein
MATFKKPDKLNGAELKQQLAEAGINVSDIFDLADGFIAFETDDAESAAQIVKSHSGNIEPKEPTIEDKLASVGLNIEDLKAALGI